MQTAALVLIAFGAGLSVLNWVCLFSSMAGRRHVSPVAPLPSLLTALGMALVDQTRAYWWAGLLTDYTLFSFIFAAPSLLADAWRTSSLTRVRLLRASSAPRQVLLSLHRGGHFLLEAKFDPPMPANPYGARIQSYGAVGRWEALPNGSIRLWGYADKRVVMLEPADIGFICREQHYPAGTEFAYDSLNGLQFQLVS